jgi:hypothetical protein
VFDLVSYSGDYDRLVPDSHEFESRRQIQIRWRLSFNGRTLGCGPGNERSALSRRPKFMIDPITTQDYLNPFSLFNQTLALIGIAVAFMVSAVMLVAKYFQERYEEDDKDPFDSSHIV